MRAVDLLVARLMLVGRAPRWITSYRGLEVVELGRSLRWCGFQEVMVKSLAGEE